jgi:hypothetical protein
MRRRVRRRDGTAQQSTVRAYGGEWGMRMCARTCGWAARSHKQKWVPCGAGEVWFVVSVWGASGRRM